MKKSSAKKTLSDRFYHLLETLFAELDQRSIQADVDSLKRAKPRATHAELVRYMTKKAALKTAAVGVAASVATGPFALLTMAPDIFNLVRQQSRLILSIAFIYGQKPNLPERFREVLAVLAVSTGLTAAKQGAFRLLEKGFEKKVARGIVQRLAGGLMTKRVPRAVPILGAVIGGSLNYAAVRAVGKAADEYYKRMKG